MAIEEALELMRSAWATRRASFDAEPAAKLELLTQAKQALTRAVAICRVEGPPSTRAEALHLLANLELELEHEEPARPLWEEAVEILRGTDEPLALAHKVRHLGDLHRRAGRLDEAEACYTEALTLYREHDAPGSLDFANAVNRMAELEERRGNRTRALALWNETHDLYAAVDVSAGVEEAERHIDALTT